MVIALAAQSLWPIFQMDVKSAFLHETLEEQVYVTQPPGYIKTGNENQVYKLKKGSLRFKTSPAGMVQPYRELFLKEGFHKCPYEHTLFVKIRDEGRILIVCLYVDDLIFTGNDPAMFEKFKKSMMTEFEMSDLGLMHYFLGIEIVQSADGIFVCQKKYVREILDRFQMQDCNPASTLAEFNLKINKDHEGKKVENTLFKQIVRSLMYLTATRPEIMHSVSQISRYMESPTKMHLAAAKRILRYLQGTRDFGLFFKKGIKSDLVGYTDSDYAGDVDDRKSTYGCIFMMGSAAVSWSSKKQPIVTLSMTETELIAATSCACQALWLKKILEELQFNQEGAVVIYCDNNSTIKLSKNPVLHGRSKHIDVKYHYLRDLDKDGKIDLKYCRSEEQLTDIFTKALKVFPFQDLRKIIGVCTLKRFVN
ncbi:uncharacterized mitochondrial protein AtMg00810-like [Ricinus communis]|uniref:uncharacterized mitochondrial protein AtMg00810-like n=1 Tax=Ricinus communis TaxID=3988 RepID=UPI00201AAD7E|nr:uncharacterized mitochondrial protein AtMg00810-like [Ricinus communis]